MEPGRSLVADSTVLLTRVNSTKKAHKRFANVDAGFNLLIRPAMYDSYHEVIVANKADAPLTTEYTVTGPICETGDILAPDRKLPEVAAGRSHRRARYRGLWVRDVLAVQQPPAVPRGAHPGDPGRPDAPGRDGRRPHGRDGTPPLAE